ncbi:hypothetical protein Hypma_007308 [Hypsizygus marmoreus]|uniref:BTB domain-containing protein n=1 Tax=Hypsizygus marmoreus TaxID=39966 RepID=A0A369K9X9_HYPMA|nr:hypothetical protein Hypma_007308 [Hypsizygus marmoreus]
MDDSDTDKPNLFTPSVSTVWFDDGNLILEADDSRFRISKGIVAAKSAVFREMMSLPQPCDQELVEGCPVVRLHDSAQDVGYFLKAIYDSSFFEPPPTPTHMDIVAGILRLSTKYDVEYLRRRAIRHLDTLYPLTLSTFDKRQDTRTTPWKDNTAFFVSLLAREFDLLWLLPCVLYCVCSCPVRDIVGGFVWNADRMQMHTDDQAACLRALLLLANAEQKDMLGFLTMTDVAGCESRECNANRLATLRTLNEMRDILNPLDAFWEKWDVFGKSVCAPCLTESKMVYEAAREAFWQSLPEMFDLPAWKTLEAMKQEALYM